MELTIDRFEEEFAVVELSDGKTIPVPRALFPDGKEGDIYSLCREEGKTEERKKRIGKLMDELWD